MSARADRKKLWRDIERADRELRRKRERELKAEIRAARSGRAPALKASRAACAVRRVELRESCDAEREAIRARTRAIIASARAEISARRADAASLRRIERGNKTAAAMRPKVSRAVRRSESDDEVRANIDPELTGLWERVKRGIRGDARKTRTEAFLEYVEAHPDEVWSGIDDKTDALIAELEARQARTNPRGKKKPTPLALELESATPRGWRWFRMQVADAFERRYGAFVPTSDGGEVLVVPDVPDRLVRFADTLDAAEARILSSRPATPAEIAAAFAARENPARHVPRPPRTLAERKATATYRATHWGKGSRGIVDTMRAADPKAGPLVALGELESVTYRTHKLGDGPSTYVHKFAAGARPVLAHNPGGLVIVGGAYTVNVRGIVG